MSPGIILAAHGSRHPGAMAALDAFRDRMAAAYPDARVEPARTVGTRHGRSADFGGVRRVPDVLAAMADAGIKRVAVQSLHVVPGEEYHEMLTGLGRFLEQGGADLTVSVGAPLLASRDDVTRAARAVLASLPPQRTAAQALVLMGHGAPPPGSGFYAMLCEELRRLDPLALCGTMPTKRGVPCPDIGRIRDELVETGVATVWLMPFFTVAGAHARADMAGDGEGSWRRILETAGLRCHPLTEGLVGREAFAALWREHLDRALARLD